MLLKSENQSIIDCQLNEWKINKIKASVYILKG